MSASEDMILCIFTINVTPNMALYDALSQRIVNLKSIVFILINYVLLSSIFSITVGTKCKYFSSPKWCVLCRMTFCNIIFVVVFALGTLCLWSAIGRWTVVKPEGYKLLKK